MAKALPIFLISVALIGSQIAYMQALAQAQWSHFAYMIIAIAMLGFGASGTWLALMRTALLQRAAAAIPLLMVAAAIAIAAALYPIQADALRFDMIEIFMGGADKTKLALTYLVFFVPFVLGALAIGLSLALNPDRVAGLYAANLFGSALGGPAAILLLGLMQPPRAAAAFGLMACAAAVLAATTTRSRFTVLVGTALCALALAFPAEIRLSSYKDLSRALDLPNAAPTAPIPHPMGTVTTVHSPAMRFAPGLSLNYTGAVPVATALFLNGDGYGSLLPPPGAGASPILDYTTRALPYAVTSAESILILGAGAGVDAAHALLQPDPKDPASAVIVTAVEAHPEVGTIASKYLQQLPSNARLNWVVADPRQYLSHVRAQQPSQQYDLIILPIVGEFGGNSGLRGVQEDFLLTRQAIAAAIDCLSSDGVLAVTVWTDYPPRQSLRLAVLLAAALEQTGIPTPGDHMLIARGWGTLTFVVSRNPFSERQLQQAAGFCADMGFDLLAAGGQDGGDTPAPRHAGADHLLEDGLRQVLRSQHQQLIAAFPFDLRPPTDTRPYFNQFLRLPEWREYQRLFLGGNAPFLEIGLPLTLLTFVQIALISLPLILIPLLFQRRSVGRGFGRPAVYFSAVGCGFMLWEIVLIQQFTLYWGNPVYAAAGVISTLLFGMGLGSAISGSFTRPQRSAKFVCTTIAITLTLYLLLLMPAIPATIGWPIAAKIVAGTLALLPPAIMMGMPFPLGLRWIDEPSRIRLAWAWGLDGYASVVSATATVLLAALFGAAIPIIAAITAYAIAATVANPSVGSVRSVRSVGSDR